MLRSAATVSVLFASLLAILALTFGAASPVRAQCVPVWQSFDPTTAGLSGVNGSVIALTVWDPDGSGPQTPKLVVGGVFSIAGSVAANGIAAFDPLTGQWSAVGSGLGVSVDGYVSAFAVLPNGDLIVAGRFTTIGGVSARNIARWNGSVWLPLGSGVGNFDLGQGEPYALAVLPNGNLVVGGNLTSAGGVAVNCIALWNGVTWSALGAGVVSSVTNPEVTALAVLPNGDLVAGGSFTAAGSVSARNIARWNGSAWSGLGSGLGSGVGDDVDSLAVLSNGDLVAAGYFTSAGGASAQSVARWNGSTWSPLGSGVFGSNVISVVRSLAVLSNGDVLAVGRYAVGGGLFAGGVSRWNGSTWSTLGTGFDKDVTSLAVLPNGDFVASGLFRTAGNVSVSGIARWNGSTWSALRTGIVEAPGSLVSFEALLEMPNGDLVAGGSFTNVGGVAANNIARWNGVTWSPLGAGTDGRVDTLAVFSNGDLVAGGIFTTAGGVSTKGIARWNGSQWSSLGEGLEAVDALAVLPNGDLVAGGFFTSTGGLSLNGIARWNGTAWSALGTGMNASAPSNAWVSALAVLSNGDLVAGGSFTTAGGVNARNIARWNGSAWAPLASGLNDIVDSLVVLPNGSLVAGGTFTSAGGVSTRRIARWNGSTWSALGTGTDSRVYALLVLPNGDLVASGNFTTVSGVNANGIARWNGSAWSPLGSGFSMGGQPGLSPSVPALAVMSNGDLIAGGYFFIAGGVVAPYIARWAPPRIFVTDQPDPTTITSGQNLVLSAAVIPGVTGVGVQWRRNGVNLTNGPGGASPSGGIVSGAAGLLQSPTNSNAVMLSIANSRPEDSGAYVAVFSNSCGSVTSAPAVVNVVAPSCSPADIADDQGNPLPPAPGVSNSGINEGDYNAFFAADGFFNQAALGTAAVGMFCDIADDQGTAFPPFGTGGINGTSNTGVNEGDYNAFFNNLFLPCV